MDSYQAQPASLSIYNSTIAFNETPTSCGAIGTSSNTQAPMKLLLWSNTIAYNRGNATRDISNTSGAGAWWPYTTPNLKVDMLNNLFMENWGKAYGKDPAFYDANFRGPTLERVSNNIFTNNTPEYYIHKPYVGTDADPDKTNKYNDNVLVKLSNTLAENGGLTQTLLVGEGSTAIGAALYNPLLQTDQRGYNRSFSPTIGAYEFGSLSTNITNPSIYKIMYNKNSQELVFDDNARNISVYNIFGHLLIQKDLTGNVLNVSTLESRNVYLSVITLNDGSKQTFKFFKN